MLWGIESESKKTAYGGDYLLTPGVMPQNEYDGFIGNKHNIK